MTRRSEKRKRRRVVSVRVTDVELAKIQRAAQDEGRTVGAYARRLLLGVTE